MLRPVDKATGKVKPEAQCGGENAREAVRQREIRDVQEAINKGHRNSNIENFFKR